MRAITVRQPWAWAIIYGGKDVENRTRNIAGDYRGPVAIHAGLTWDDSADALQFDVGHPLTWALAREGKRGFATAEQGVILGVVDVVGVHEWDDPDICRGEYVIGGDFYCSPWAMPSLHHITLANPRPLAEPVPAKGRLGMWTLPDDVEAAVTRQVTA